MSDITKRMFAYTPSDYVKKNNPEIFKSTHSVVIATQGDPVPISNPKNPQGTHPDQRSHLGIKFLFIWEALKGPTLHYEYRFHPKRRWKFDFCHEESKVAIEIEGAVYRPGKGHSSVSGILRDIDKYNEATLLGFRVIRLHNRTIIAENLERIIELTKK